ncbi:ABC transporter ATP-binding protein [Bacillus sp. Marseille-Q1617]|uniref:ABC transporter ATP-binding protein n=1 Tax=Bacillus sp. Marseille-Q1617 TaxID=2736887 RepID=UPI00158AA71E|nr:ABC transporter ATP-binding protein [Bacillus sp. Marseille-Q1617]
MKTYPLELREIRKTFKDGEKKIDVLHSLSFKAERGKLTAILGPSGSGKSTFLSIAGALSSPDEGEMLVNGQNIVHLSDKQKTNVRLHSIGYIFQSSYLIPYLKVREQLKLPAELAGKWNRETQLRAADLLKSVGLEHRADHYSYQLSGGEKQRVAIARAFMNDAGLILADEPTASLDSGRSIEIIRLISKVVKEKQKAAVMVTHDESILHLCDDIYEMKDGKLEKRK